MTRLHIFDMDGTLLRGTTASLEISRGLGCLAELLELEARFAAGALDTRGFAAELHCVWADLTPTVVAAAFDAAPWIGGLAEVLADIRARGEHSMVITMSPDFFAGRLGALGVDRIVASRFPPLPFRIAPDPEHILTPAHKVIAAEKACAELGLGRERCIAYGDSDSDIPLFRHLRRTVAVNATAKLRELALLHYDGDDLREPYRAVRRADDTESP
ncbi:HAD family hydrolase [Nocardia arthritidis]|uniref:HAD hydrolase family protein n=1 Tax=Nocardia arthritidis TaxID=228602 RepID=A0A6G9Y662_9NOCA|nr:haloacid dehalogenase-like hydrolase [Nocardia arthritidis]QIS08728.1 HAD hydrolase family protein [Nocardia arthritidis]